jgi:hypothetical protein
MPKDRLRDTLDYLTARAGAGNLPSVGIREVADFEKKVRHVDRTNAGNALSLGWSRLDRNRPDENTRHAIRAYLLASIYNSDVTATGAHAEAVKVKTFGTDWLHRKIAKRIRQYLCLDDPIKDLGRHEKAEILKRQRRLSYGDEAAVQTIAVLRDYFKAGTRVRHIPKPSHPTFTGTLFAEQLEADAIKAVVVMGYDANQCIKATVFGVPSETREEAQREPSAKEVEGVMKLHPKLTVQEAQKQATPMKKVTIPYVPGLLDRNITVITSRAVMASSYRALEPEWGKIASLS